MRYRHCHRLLRRLRRNRRHRRCHGCWALVAPPGVRSVAPDPQDSDVQRGRVQSVTTDGEASQHGQQQQPQQQQREKDEKSKQV